MEHELLVVGNIAKDLILGEEKFGGSAAVIAVNSSRLRISTGVFSVIGRDAFSERYKTFLIKNGVDIGLVSQQLETLPECVATQDSHSRIALEWHDHNCHKTMETIHIDTKKIQEYTIVHLVSCPPGLSRRIAQLGVQGLSYEPGPYLLSNPYYLDPEIINKSRFIFFNEDEYQAAKEATGFKTQDFLAGSDRVMIITLGERGSDLYFESEGILKKIHIDAIQPKGKIEDPTGAGDCYKAGFFAGYFRRKPLPECAAIGSHMGAACVIQNGGILPPGVINQIRRTCQL